MSMSFLAALQPVRWSARAALLAALFTLGGCATPYLDGAVKDVPASEFVRPVQAKTVQLAFEFQTNGKPNSRATDLLKAQALDNIKATGLFAEVHDKPVPGAVVLNVTVNNVALLDDAMKKGFLTGLTFGIKGSTVTDGYVCTASIALPGQAAPIIKTAKHAIHSTVGAADAPPNGIKANGLEEAARIMLRQILGVSMLELSRDPAFSGRPAPARSPAQAL